MTMQIEIVESQVTFGELPRGATFAQRPGDIGRWFKKVAVMDKYNAVHEDGSFGEFCKDEPVYSVAMPPGATLKRKPRMVRVDELPRGSWYLSRGKLRLSNDDDLASAAGRDCRGCIDVATGQLGIAKATDTLVQPCRVEVRVFPEYES